MRTFASRWYVAAPLVLLATVGIAVGMFVAMRTIVSSTPVVPGMRGCAYLTDRADLIACVESRANVDPQKPLTSFAGYDRTMEGAFLQDGCHAAGHTLARRFVTTFDDWPQRTYAGLEGMREMGQCSFGFLHGLLEEAVRVDTAGIAELAGRVCDRTGERARVECYHGIGHGLVRARKSAADSRARCGELADPISCVSGMHMERAFSFPADRRPADLCADVPEREVMACFLYVPIVAGQQGRALETPRDTIEFCNEAIPDEPRRALIGCVLSAAFVLGDKRSSECARVRRDDARRACSKAAVAGVGAPVEGRPL